MWNLNDQLLNKPWIREEITIEVRRYFEMNNNKNITYQ